jgi:hypothetical protein
MWSLEIQMRCIQRDHGQTSEYRSNELGRPFEIRSSAATAAAVAWADVDFATVLAAFQEIWRVFPITRFE